MQHLLRLILALAAGLTMPGASHAQAINVEQENLAVLSLVGDAMTIVSFVPATGSHVDTNHHQTLPLPDRSLDNAILRATDQALKKAAAKSSAVLLSSSDPTLFSDQHRLFDGDRLLLPPDLQKVITDHAATHLLLLTKHRADAALKFRHSTGGSGKLEGLGFYLDTTVKVRTSNGRKVGTGLIAPYVYLDLWLVNAKTWAVVKRRSIKTAETISSARGSDDTDPWKSFTDAQKTAMLLGSARRSIAEAVQQLLTPD